MNTVNTPPAQDRKNARLVCGCHNYARENFWIIARPPDGRPER